MVWCWYQLEQLWVQCNVQLTATGCNLWFRLALDIVYLFSITYKQKTSLEIALFP